MIDWLPWWAWSIPLAGVAFGVWHYLGSKAALASLGAAAIALFGARQRESGREAAKRENEREAWDAIDKANDARADAHRRNSDPERLRDNDGFRRD